MRHEFNFFILHILEIDEQRSPVCGEVIATRVLKEVHFNPVSTASEVSQLQVRLLEEIQVDVGWHVFNQDVVRLKELGLRWDAD